MVSCEVVTKRPELEIVGSQIVSDSTTRKAASAGCR